MDTRGAGQRVRIQRVSWASGPHPGDEEDTLGYFKWKGGSDIHIIQKFPSHRLQDVVGKEDLGLKDHCMLRARGNKRRRRQKRDPRAKRGPGAAPPPSTLLWADGAPACGASLGGRNLNCLAPLLLCQGRTPRVSPLLSVS